MLFCQLTDTRSIQVIGLRLGNEMHNGEGRTKNTQTLSGFKTWKAVRALKDRLREYLIESLSTSFLGKSPFHFIVISW